MTLWELHKKISNMLTYPANPSAMTVRAILVRNHKPSEDLDLIKIEQNNEGIFVHLKIKE